MLDTPPALLSGPSRDKVEDFPDCILLLGRPLFHAGSQQLVDGCQLLYRLNAFLPAP
jgi:hypothetical protein